MSVPFDEPMPIADLREAGRTIIKRIIRSMARTLSDEDLKLCIMTAREHGHLTDEETEFYLAAWGLRDA